MYDAIIIGAGVAGPFLATLLKDLDILILEKDREIAVKDSGIVSTSIRDFIKPKALIQDKIKEMQFISPSGLSFSLQSDNPFAYILKRRQFSMYLRKKARKATVPLASMSSHRALSLPESMSWLSGAAVCQPNCGFTCVFSFMSSSCTISAVTAKPMGQTTVSAKQIHGWPWHSNKRIVLRAVLLQQALRKDHALLKHLYFLLQAFLKVRQRRMTTFQYETNIRAVGENLPHGMVKIDNALAQWNAQMAEDIVADTYVDVLDM